MNIKPIIVKTGSAFKVVGTKTKDGALLVTDTLEFAGEKTADLVGSVMISSKEGFLAHRSNHADRMLARSVRRDERKVERAAKRAEKEQAEKAAEETLAEYMADNS